MDITITQIVYALVFVSILLAVEGVYLFLRGSDEHERSVNRRMKLAQKRDTNVLNPSIMRRQVSGGFVSQMVLSTFPKLDDLLWAADVKISPAQALLIAVGGAVFLFIGLTLLTGLTPLITLAAALGIGIGLPLLLLQLRVDGQRKKFSEQLPDSINLISRGLQAGHPVPVALELVAKEMGDPLGTEIGMALDEINFGLDRDVALRNVSERFPDDNFKFFLAAMAMQRETGGNLVDVLDNLTRVIRERENMRKKAMAMSAEGRMTAMLVGSMPYLLMGFLLLTNPSFILGVVDEPAFWPLMGGAWVLWLLGIIWIWKMVNIKV